jgi:hypothetical protein
MINAYSDFYPWMMIDLPRCPKSLMLQHLKKAFYDFTFRTESWYEELDKVDIVADQTTYALRASVDALIKRINWVKINGVVQNVTHYELQNEYQLYWNEDYVPDTSDTDALQVKVTFYPDWDSDVLPENYMTRWGDAIRAGAMSTLMSMSNRHWSNPQRAAEEHARYLTLFNDAIKERYTKGKSGSLQIDLTNVSRRFA